MIYLSSIFVLFSCINIIKSKYIYLSQSKMT